MVKSWDITIDEFIHILQVMKEESGGNTIIGTATDVTEELKFFDTKVRRRIHLLQLHGILRGTASEMVMKEEED